MEGSTGGDEARKYLLLREGARWLPRPLQNWISFFVLYCNFVPISMYISLEAVNYVQVCLQLRVPLPLPLFHCRCRCYCLKATATATVHLSYTP